MKQAIRIAAEPFGICPRVFTPSYRRSKMTRSAIEPRFAALVFSMAVLLTGCGLPPGDLFGSGSSSGSGYSHHCKDSDGNVAYFGNGCPYGWTSA